MYSYTEKATEVLKSAEKLAYELRHNYIGTEHLLYGLCDIDDGMSSLVLKNLGITSEKVKEEILTLIGEGNMDIEIQGFTPRVKRVIEMAYVEARNDGAGSIGTEHLLLGILNEGESVAIRILMNLGIDFQSIYSELEKNISNYTNKSSDDVNAKTPTLNQFGRDLTQMAKDGKLDPVIGRNNEMQRLIQILSRRTKNNPCLVGEPGVGKTAVVEGLAQAIIAGNVPEELKNRRIVTLDISSMVAGAKYRGDFEERLKKSLNEIISNKNTIIFIDEIHTIVGAGAAEGAIDAANILKPMLSRGEIQLIGATTLNEYRKYIEKDSALERRFQPITVGEPSLDETFEILKGLKDKYESHHKVIIPEEVLKSAVELSSRYINDRFLPDKAIDLIDEACSKVKLKTYTQPDDIKKLESELKELKKKKEDLVKKQKFEEAAEIRDKENVKKTKLEKANESWKTKADTTKIKLSVDDIAEVISLWTGVPVKQLTKTEQERLNNLENILHERVVGQNEAVLAVAKSIKRGRVGLKDPKKPIGSFIFLGPTGVGKTELAKALAESLFGDENAMIRVDMSEFMEQHTVSKLIGSPPGYVGYDDAGQLTEKIRRKPYSVVLFDEIEKAHPDVLNILLQILDDGQLTDGQGKKVDFKNTIIIMTSNVGAKLIVDKKTIGFENSINDQKEYLNIKEKVMGELKNTFRPEFLNRIDDIIVFHQLEKEELKQIVKIMLNQFGKRVAQKGITISYENDIVDYLVNKGYDKNYGARPLKRTIQTEIEDKLAEAILNDRLGKGKSVNFVLKDNEIAIE